MYLERMFCLRKVGSNGRGCLPRPLQLSRFAALLILISNLQGLRALKITNLTVPEIVQYGTQESVVLDCDYLYGNNTSGLVVKWFFNNKTRPVYQWIPTQKPQDLGILRGRVDLSYKVSDDVYEMHRAMRIVRPGTDLSGDYTCVVSTFTEQDQRTKKMIIFAPESNFRLIQNKSADRSELRVLCSAEDMFPEPNITLSTPERFLPISNHSLVLVAGRYHVMSEVVLDEDELESPTEFICTLRIPQGNYVVRKETIYYPGPLSTTPDMPTAADMQLASKGFIKYSNGQLLQASLFVTLASNYFF